MTDTRVSSWWVEPLALATVYFVWGSTYLAIAVAIESLPPFLMTSGRFVLAGSMLLAWAKWRGAPRAKRIHWRSALAVGTLMMFGGTGGVTFAEQHVPSGFAALMIAAVPIWAVLLDWLLFDGARPNQRLAIGLAVGLSGVALLIGPSDITGGEQDFNALGVAVLIAAAISWAIGSLYSRRAPLPANHAQASGMEMLCGGAVLILAGTLSGEWSKLDVGAISTRSLVAYAYLLTVGGVVVFSAYFWLLRNTIPVRATSYAYVNPVIAVLLGWAVAGEALTARMMVAAAVIVGSVALITSVQGRGQARSRAGLRRSSRTVARLDR